MREIKFRGKEVNTGVWVFGGYEDFKPRELGKIREPNQGLVFAVDPETVGQFTGLKDCDGREIYEGDIVSWGDGTSPTSVRWDEHFAYYVIMESLILSHACKAVRVIGNIHDNPDLLEVAHD